MADVNDVHDMRGQRDRAREKLLEADIADSDRRAIDEFADHRIVNEGRSPGTVRDDIGNLRRIAERANKPLLSFDSVKDATAFFERNRREFEVSPKSNDNYRAKLRVFFEWLDTDGDYGTFEFYDDIKIPTRDVDPVDAKQMLSPDEVTEIREACPRSRDKAFVEFLADTGMRVAAALQIRRGDIKDLDSRTPTFTPNADGVSQKGLTIEPRPIIHSQRWLRQYLRHSHPDESDQAPLFPVFAYESREPGNRAVSPSSMQSLLNRRAESAGLERSRVHPHAFRHVATTRMRRDLEMNWDDIQHRTGWSPSSIHRMKKIYSHVTAEEKNDRIFTQVGLVDSSDSEDPESMFTECTDCGQVLTNSDNYCSNCGSEV